ncbi:uncharacterized protein LOC131667858 [Phymastichus coffea]|uniref:uncharacterized protein LOC131667858 n=1 Tax=Phymastichus coffea TaxID=108790 RepID=UPI00273BCA91|nr:uncharacterized protein LOC131667858 [Phymastichus coffea]
MRICGMPRRFIAALSLLAFVYDLRSEKIIVNTDAGADDAVGLLLLLRYEAANKNSGFQVIGITCSYGNTEENNVVTNVLRTLTVTRRGDIPVYSGATQGFNEPFSTDNYFGSDGFSDAQFDEEITAKVDRSKHVALALVDMVKQYSGNVSILSLAPLTNIGLAISLDRNFTKHVKHFYVMGTSVAGVGNKRPNVEFNIAADPESTAVFFNSTQKSQITLVPWETVLNTELSKDWRKNVLGKYNSPYIEFLNKVEWKSFAVKREQWVSADATTVACMIEPSLINEYKVVNVQAVTDGLARGSVLVDYGQRTGKTDNSKIVLKINETVYKNMLIEYLTCEEITC